MADLTGLNANVFYELGLAHALRKPVVLLTQSVDEVPFDLKSYRLLAYDVHFAGIAQSKAELEPLARGFSGGTVLFGNPVTDFYSARGTNRAFMQTDSATPGDLIDDRGFLDHIEALGSGYEALASLVNEVGSHVEEVGGATKNTTGVFKSLGSSSDSKSVVLMKSAARELASRINQFSGYLRQTNDHYESVLSETEKQLGIRDIISVSSNRRRERFSWPATGADRPVGYDNS